MQPSPLCPVSRKLSCPRGKASTFRCQATHIHQGVHSSVRRDAGASDLWGTKENLSLVVDQSNGPTLLDWLPHLRLDWKHIVHQAKEHPKLLEILDKYEEVFRDELDLVDMVPVKLHLKEGSTRKFCRPCPVPFAIKGVVEKEIRHLEEEGVLVKLETSQWATPIVSVPKKNDEFRICGDYKTTIWMTSLLLVALTRSISHTWRRCSDGYMYMDSD